MHFPLLSAVSSLIQWYLPLLFTKLPSDWMTILWYMASANLTLSLSKEAPNTISCPYEYILDIYGNNHFCKVVQILDPTLEERDPGWFALILELMDAIHFGAILVDDVADNSMLRKGRTAAHRIYGSTETINRAYLRILQVVEKCRLAKPSAIPSILDNLTQIHKGQDDSLVWRRDGFPMAVDGKTALSLYRDCASLKTGALFRLVGQLVTGTCEKDEVMSSFGWYCQLQNDCKNVFSSDVVIAKGTLAEDLANGEYSFPIILALYASPPIREAVSSALCHHGKSRRHVQARVVKAARMLQHGEVRDRCLRELEELKVQNRAFASAWGRQEEMKVGSESATAVLGGYAREQA